MYPMPLRKPKVGRYSHTVVVTLCLVIAIALLSFLKNGPWIENSNSIDVRASLGESGARCNTGLAVGTWRSSSYKDDRKCRGGGTMCFPGEMVSFDFSKELKPNCKGGSGRSNGGTKAFVHRRVEYWINAFRNLRVTVVGDSIGRHFMKAFVKMLGGAVEFTAQDRHSDKKVTVGRGTEVSFRWHPTAQNLEGIMQERFHDQLERCCCSETEVVLVTNGLWDIRWTVSIDRYAKRLQIVSKIIEQAKQRCPRLLFGLLIPPMLDVTMLNPARAVNMTAAKYNLVMDGLRRSQLHRTVDFVINGTRLVPLNAPRQIFLDGVHHKPAVYEVFSEIFANHVDRTVDFQKSPGG